jgi:hypothetical protein
MALIFHHEGIIIAQQINRRCRRFNHPISSPLHGRKDRAMQKLVVYLVIIAAIAAAWVMFKRPVDPLRAQAKAQISGNKVIEYWLDCAMADQLTEMNAVSFGVAKGQAQGMLDLIHENEGRNGEQFDGYHLMGMGGGGAVKAILSAGGEAILMQMTIRAQEKEGKFWVVQATPD